MFRISGISTQWRKTNMAGFVFLQMRIGNGQLPHPVFTLSTPTTQWQQLYQKNRKAKILDACLTIRKRCFKQIWKKEQSHNICCLFSACSLSVLCCSELGSFVFSRLHLSFSPETSLSASYSSICRKFRFSFEMISQQADLCRFLQLHLLAHAVTRFH